MKSTNRPDDIHVQVTSDGPYLVFGPVPLKQQIITNNSAGYSWSYTEGHSYDNGERPYALCRCGNSKNKPFCDGSHTKADWDPRETASFEPILDNAEVTEGPRVLLFDNEKYCAFARFCDAHGRAWNIAEQSDNDEDIEILKREVGNCPAGRLMLKDLRTNEFYEPEFQPEIGIIEDAPLRISGPLWLRGGIKVISASGKSYEVRNRVTLCRCGQSSNKPFCDGTHASMKFRDNLPIK